MPHPAVTVTNEQGVSPYVLTCEHASNWMPPDYAGLGLKQPDLNRHIAWDIGAANVARRLSGLLDAALVEGTASRLLIDLNRPTHSATSIPEVSEATVIPGNVDLADAERQRRITTWFDPYQKRLTQLLDERQTANKPTILISIHSFTPVFLGQSRPWRAGVLYRRSAGYGSVLVAALGGDADGIAHNQPYQIDDASDYTIPVHGEARGLEAVLVELRQDLIASAIGAAQWADYLAAALLQCGERSG
jgi:predicted N-formylglutamate amidohydrolase